ncbi:hypothetical protein B1759_15785 [Rubrivirga sp. SAORIC476]|uniref:hypothetical protein n=1 Tax=Rubrivirga sp. SAORIC476 TaxID=1961794 RepID=UPI000BA950C2|nr:hypothetical protein [Rubrivirga sp. SAORIC476]PAP78900.1 hypothetical protein B1759_15785 [Rubrivirga sp. SAORIC476]
MSQETVDREASQARVSAAEADAPQNVEEILALLPDLSAEVVRQDVASGRLYGVRSQEHDRLVGLIRALRTRLRAAETSALHALMAAGCDASAALRWLRSDDGGEPRYQRADADMVHIPILNDLDQLSGLEWPPRSRKKPAAGAAPDGDGAT